MSSTSTNLRAEIKSVLDKHGVYESKGFGNGQPHVRSLSATDVALLVAEGRGIKLKRPGLYESQASRLSGTGVTVSSIKKTLAEMVADDSIVAFDGDSLKRKGFGHGVHGRATYYFSKRAAGILARQAKQRESVKQESDARRRAERIVLDRYRDEVETLVRTILSGEAD